MHCAPHARLHTLHPPSTLMAACVERASRVLAAAPLRRSRRRTLPAGAPTRASPEPSFVTVVSIMSQ